MLTVSCCAAFLLHQEAPRIQDALTATVSDGPLGSSPAVLRVAAQSAPAAARRVYPFSIVPGGVGSRAELAHAVLNDKTVAAHYAGFAVDKASLRTVAKARAVYVSYRKGDQVYWTARPVTLAEGEAVLSDGRSDIRARCGNRISDTPRLPVEAKGPGEEELDTPVAQAGEGTLVQTAAEVEEEGEGQQFMAQSFPNGAGLLVATQAASSLSQSGFGNGSPGLDRANWPAIGSGRGILLAGISGTASGLSGSSSSSSSADGSAANSNAAAPSDSLSYGSDSGGSGKGGDPALPGSINDTLGGTGGTGGAGGTTGNTGGSGTVTAGDKPAGGDTPKPPPSTLQTDPATGGKNPAKPHELPEPDSLWLTGVAAAALLLHRRLRPRKPR